MGGCFIVPSVPIPLPPTGTPISPHPDRSQTETFCGKVLTRPHQTLLVVLSFQTGSGMDISNSYYHGICYRFGSSAWVASRYVALCDPNFISYFWTTLPRF